MSDKSAHNPEIPDKADPPPAQRHSIIDALKAPTASDLARKRKVPCNLQHSGKRFVHPKGTSNPNVSIRQRLTEFPGENFKESAGTLFCTGCREEVGLKKTIIQQHIKSSKHCRGKEKLAVKERREKDIANVLIGYDNENHPKGETLSMAQRVYRFKVVRTFLKAGVAINKIDQFREIFEEQGYSLSHSSNLSSMIDVINKEEKEKVKKEIAGRNVSVIFDGTTHVAEAVNIILRFVSDDWKIEQRLVELLLVTKSMTGEELAQQLLSCLSTNLGINSALLLAAMRDRASVNDVAVRTLKILYPNVVDIGCFSHTLDHVGEKMETTILDQFMKAWISLFAHSPKSRIAFKTQTGQSPKTHSATRWWSKFEVIKQVHDLFGDIPNFLNTADLPAVTKKKLTDICNQPQQQALLKIELAATVDAMEPFVKATYNLEGDGPLALRAYQELRTVESSIANAYYPNIIAVSRLLSQGNFPVQQQWINYATQCIRPAYQFYQDKFIHGPLQPLVMIFKSCRLFDPVKVKEMQPDAAAVNALRCVPFFDADNVIQPLQRELAAYQALTDDVAGEINVLEWWSQHSEEIPSWTSACKQILLLQPSSAASERVFSLLQNSFNNRQQALQDYIETSLILQYNNK